MRIDDICQGCEHVLTNNNDGLRRGCRAFPDGIPRFIGDTNSHDIPVEWQVSDYVYTPAKKKVDRYGRKIKIYQESNPYSDENGRYKEV